MFTFGYCNGNTGNEQTFGTRKEAEDAASSKWEHLTLREKKRYTSAEDGAYFAVFQHTEADDCQIVHDFADDLREEGEE